MVSSTRCLAACLSLLLSVAASAHADDVLKQVPRDALGFVVVRNLTATDAKATKLFQTLGVRLPGPLAVLRTTAGVNAGLDRQRDLLVVLLPPESDSREFHLAVWLPVKDYRQLIRSVEGDPERRIAAVTVAGEDLLAMRHEDWVVVMDPDQRGRLERLRDAPAAPLDAWSPWLESSDVAVVVLPNGVPTAWQWLTRPAEAESTTDAGGEPLGPQGPRRRRSSNAWPPLRDVLRTWLTAVPEFSRWAAEAQGVGLRLRIDEAGNAVAGARIALPTTFAERTSTAVAADRPTELPRLYATADFVVQGAGLVSPRWSSPAVAPYVRHLADDLATNYGIPLDETDVDQFRAALETALADVQAFAVLSRPGEGDEGVFTNNLLAVRVPSAREFLQKAAEAMRLWNEMLGEAEGPLRLVFDAKPVTIADRQGTEYSIDMAAAVGAPALPEMRQTMERLFGPGGAFRLQFVECDHRTVLLAAATEPQVAKAIAAMAQPAAASEGGELGAADKLLASDADWRVFVSPHGYYRWLRRQMDAVLGPVIGGPVVREFPESPPVGIVGGVDGQILTIELAAPADTLRRAGEYLRQ